MPIDRALIRKTANVYAETLVEALKPTGAVFGVSGELEQISAAIRAHTELRGTLTDRTIPGNTRTDILKEVFMGFNPILLEVLGVMVERDEVYLLSRINERYLELAEEALDSVIIDVTTVVELDDALRDSIKKKYSAQFNRGVLLREHIDPSLVGGIVLSAHGNLIDASVNSQLENARAVLAKQW